MSEENNEKALVPLFMGEADRVHPLARYGESRVVRALSDRVMVMDRRTTPLNQNEAILTAQAAIAYRLDPFMGELWSWVQTIQGRRVLTIMKGRDGTLKIAKANARRDDTHLLPPRFRQITDESERTRLFIPEGSLSFECEQQDHKSLMAWQQVVNTLKDAGFSKDEISLKAGDPPADYGLGILAKNEIANLNKGKNKMTHVERCQKRAHTAALRKRWAAQEHETLPASSLDTSDYIIEGEWMDVSPEELNQKAVSGAESLFGEGGGDALKKVKEERPKGTRPWKPEDVRNRILQFASEYKGSKKNEQRPGGTLVTYIAWQMNECFKGDPKPDGKRISVLSYIFGPVKSTKDLNGAQLKAVERWLEPSEHEGEGSGIVPRKEARLEAAAMFAAHLKEQGQQELISE